jgi:hypothetical protein
VVKLQLCVRDDISALAGQSGKDTLGAKPRQNLSGVSSSFDIGVPEISSPVVQNSPVQESVMPANCSSDKTNTLPSIDWPS